jgi:hypothetical protein
MNFHDRRSSLEIVNERLLCIETKLEQLNLRTQVSSDVTELALGDLDAKVDGQPV